MTRFIIDVRTPQEFAARHIEGAINIDFHDPQFNTQMMEFPKDTELVVYCNAGGRAGRAKTRLKELGFSDVTSYGIMGASAATGTQVLYQTAQRD
ncbi:MAG: rhodanese-like domain-containing protein [Propionibacteriaceae bacterium]|jgi:rhodanese-related sulfurtransferase|nr:rhodanese-like domain-containing protein [Propionibacteriaceae bacterium]